MVQWLQKPTVQRVCACLVFILFLGVGIAVYRDYGLSWDEPISRDNNGVPNYKFLIQLKQATILGTGEKYHGPAFEIVLILMEKAFRLEDPREIYLARHLATFLLFFASVVVFYRIVRRRFQSRWIGLTGALFLILSPRIFADAFYNSKDLAFLSCFVFALATLFRFLQDLNHKNALLHGLACGFMIAIRLPGVILPAITLGLAGGIWLASFRHRLSKSARLAPLATYVAAFCLFTILFWPVLWLNPLAHIHRAWLEMSQYPYHGPMLYLGKRVNPCDLPWHYLPVWIAVTTPLLYLGLFLVGVVGVLAACVRSPLRTLAERPVDLGFLLAFFLPLAVVILGHSTIYDGWRHLYFVYPAMLFLAIHGLVAVYRLGQRLPRPLPSFAAASCVVGTALPLVAIAVTMAREHPHEYVYFNHLAGRDLHQVKSRFEIDYWGISCREGLEHLLRHDQSPTVRVFGETTPCLYNELMLPPHERDRLVFTSERDADYWLSHYPPRDLDGPAESEVFALKRDGAKIMVVRKIH
jgi:hypothetical protein